VPLARIVSRLTALALSLALAAPVAARERAEIPAALT
jgi:hypothetical protein